MQATNKNPIKKIKFIIKHNIEEIGKLISEKNNCPELEKKLTNIFKARLGEFIDITETYIFESPYVEEEWASLYALHYCKKHYHSVTPFSSRLHLISENIKDESEISKISEKSYLGYLTIRPIPVVDSMISKIILKPYNKFYDIADAEEWYMITTKYASHIKDISFEIETFPFYSQDSMVSICAHADMLMLVSLMSKKYGMNDVPIDRLIQKILPFGGRIIPSESLTLQQIAFALMENGYNVKIKSFKKREIENLMVHIDAYIESGLPCIISFNRHVITIAGHTLENGNLNYIIFDDSGYHIQKFFEKGKLFSIKESGDGFKKKLESKVTKDEIFAILPEFERLHFPFESVQKTVEYTTYNAAYCMENLREDYYEYLFRWEDVPGSHDNQLKRFLNENLGVEWIENAIIEKTNDDKTIKVESQGKSLEIKIEKTNGKWKRNAIINNKGKLQECVLFLTKDDEGHIYKDIYKSKLKFRFLLTESNKLKNFFSEEGIHDLDDASLPRFVWYVELYDKVRSKEHLLNSIVIDGLAHKDDVIYSIIPSAQGSSYTFYKPKKRFPHLTRLK